MAELKPKLQLSNGYDLDLSQTARLLQWLEEQTMPRWSPKAASDDLGLAERMVESIASHTMAMDFMLPRTGRLTPLGKAILKIDPYLTGQQTPWIVHYNLSADPYHLVWHRMANEVITSNCCISLQDAKGFFTDLQTSHSVYSATKHLVKEISVFFRAYAEGALSRLSYLEHRDDAFAAPSTLRVPPVVFGYSLLTFAARYRPGETAISVSDIAAATSSPGRIFLMREPDVRAHLERMHRNDVVNIENKGHLDQVRFVNPPDPADYLLAHFEDTED